MANIEYKGFVPPKNWTIDRVSSSISPEEFFQKYVATRTPCIITSTISESDWKAKDWTEDYLRKRAGHSMVKVEAIGPHGSFGSGLPRKAMSFSQFLEELRNNQNLYLTTQYEHEGDEEIEQLEQINQEEAEEEEESGSEHPLPPLKLSELIPSPLTDLLPDFPLVPDMLGNSVLQQVNLWLGRSKNGTSSGLHCDFHDNLYALLKGKKRFTLFCPAEAPKLYTNGFVTKVHTNGLVQFGEDEDLEHEGEGGIKDSLRADGVHKVDVQQFAVSILQKEVDRLATEIFEGGKKSKTLEKDLKLAEKKLHKAMDALLDAERKYGDEAAGQDQDGDDDEEIDDEDEEEEDFDEEGDDGMDMWNKLKKMDDFEFSDEEGEEEEDDEVNQKSSKTKKKQDEGKGAKEQSEDPSSFSRVPVSLLHDPFKAGDLKRQFPDFPLQKRVTVEVKAGEMLWLPASWFHEVTSFGDGSNSNASAGASNIHMAFNWWFHPISQFDSFEEPYEDDFWKSRVDALMPKILAKREKLLAERREEEESYSASAAASEASSSSSNSKRERSEKQEDSWKVAGGSKKAKKSQSAPAAATAPVVAPQTKRAPVPAAREEEEEISEVPVEEVQPMQMKQKEKKQVQKKKSKLVIKWTKTVKN